MADQSRSSTHAAKVERSNQSGSAVVIGVLRPQYNKPKSKNRHSCRSLHYHSYIQEEGEFLDENMINLTVPHEEREDCLVHSALGSLWCTVYFVVHISTNACHSLCSSNMFLFPSQSCASLVGIIAIKIVCQQPIDTCMHLLRLTAEI